MVWHNLRVVLSVLKLVVWTLTICIIKENNLDEIRKCCWYFCDAFAFLEDSPPNTWSLNPAYALQVFIVIIRQGNILSLGHVFFQLTLPFLIHLNFWWSQRRHSCELEVRVTDKLTSKPKERLLKVVVRLSANVVVLNYNIRNLQF